MFTFLQLSYRVDYEFCRPARRSRVSLNARAAKNSDELRGGERKNILSLGSTRADGSAAIWRRRLQRNLEAKIAATR